MCAQDVCWSELLVVALLCSLLCFVCVTWADYKQQQLRFCWPPVNFAAHLHAAANLSQPIASRAN